MFVELGTQKPQERTFAISVAVRNPQGRVLAYKSMETDSAAELSDFWELNSERPKSKKKVVNNK